MLSLGIATVNLFPPALVQWWHFFHSGAYDVIFPDSLAYGGLYLNVLQSVECGGTFLEFSFRQEFSSPPPPPQSATLSD